MTKQFSGIQDRLGVILLAIIGNIMGASTHNILVCKKIINL